MSRLHMLRETKEELANKHGSYRSYWLRDDTNTSSVTTEEDRVHVVARSQSENSMAISVVAVNMFSLNSDNFCSSIKMKKSQ